MSAYTSRKTHRASPSELNLFVLNEPQRRAVLHDAGPLLVLAGAGSGKTRVITYRIARLLLDGAAPASILALTFTNKAAREMRDRLFALVGKVAEEVQLSTFHALGLKILKSEHQKLGLPKNFSIYDSADQLSLMRDLLRHNTVADRRLDAQRLLDLVLARKKGGPKAGIVGDGTDDYSQAAEALYPHYRAQMRAYGAIDFDDLIGLAIELLKDKEILTRYRQKFAHLLVDEYQDTSPDQLLLVQLIAGDSGRVCVVGDDDQAIYAWRGAASDNILSFARAFSGTTEIVLDQNYRSTNHILCAANSVIAPNTQRREKKLWSALGDGAPVVLTTCAHEEDEAEYVAETIHKLNHEGIGCDDIAVLFRANAQSRVLEQVLLAERVPHRILGGQALFDRKDVRDAMAFLALAINPRDEVALRRVVNVPPRGLGPATLGHLSAWAQERKLPLWEALVQADKVDALTPQARRGALELIGSMRRFSPQLREGGQDVADSVDALFGALKLRDHILSANDTAGVAANRLANLKSVILSLERFVGRQRKAASAPEAQKSVVADFLRAAALRGGSDASEQAEPQGEVTLMSIHAAKGLEFPCVLLVGLEEDLLPHKRSVEDLSERAQTSIAEERRLFYVGMTRARQQLFLSHARERNRYGRRVPTTPSRFLSDLPDSKAHVVKNQRRHEGSVDQRNEASEKRAADFFAEMRAKLGQST